MLQVKHLRCTALKVTCFFCENFALYGMLMLLGSPSLKLCCMADAYACSGCLNTTKYVVGSEYRRFELI